MIPFDKRGKCKAPLTRKNLLETAQSGNFSNVFLFSHGWNNDWPTATARYEGFVGAFQSVKPPDGPLDNPGYRPLLVGISWPSTILVMPWESGPQLAVTGGGIAVTDETVQAWQAELDLVADLLPDGQIDEFYRIANDEREMSELDAHKLAEFLAPLYGNADDPDDTAGDAPTADDLVEFWRGPLLEAMGGDAGSPATGQPVPAGLLPGLPDPRSAIRTFTVWKMKDRAGSVGATGVAKLLNDIRVSAPGARTHLVGHSYGAKVVLSAVCAPDHFGPPVDSMLLLQPAVNGFCFSDNVAGQGFAGGYRRALERVRQPILSTYSKHDMPLTRAFHLALRRKTDLGETRIAAFDAPSRYAALGGFGPRGCSPTECKPVDINSVGDPYPLTGAAPQIYGVRGDAAISGHGDVVNPETAWALYCLVTADR
jgi:hypothetical protein